MLNSRTLTSWIVLSLLLHLIFVTLVSMIRWTPPRPEDVMVVDLADIPRSPEFTPPRPGVVKGAPPKAVPPPKPLPKAKTRVPPPPQHELSGRVPDLPVNPDLPLEKKFPVPRAKKEDTAKPADIGKPPQLARREEAPQAAGQPVPAPTRSLRDITPSLGDMVLARVDPGRGREGDLAAGSAVGTRGKAVQKGEISEEGGGGAHLTALNAPEIQYISYFASIKRKIELIWQYPREAAAAGIQGDLLIDFVIGRNGDLESLRLLQGSGYKILDDEALGSIRRAAPYNPIPEQYRIPNLRIRAHFVYEMHALKIQ